MMMMVCGVCLKYEYEGREREREREIGIVFICWLIGRVENGLEGTSFNPRERESDKRGRVEMVGLLVFDSILVFFDTFYFTHKVIIVFYCMEQKQFCFHFT